MSIDTSALDADTNPRNRYIIQEGIATTKVGDRFITHECWFVIDQLPELRANMVVSVHPYHDAAYQAAVNQPDRPRGQHIDRWTTRAGRLVEMMEHKQEET